MDNQIGLFELVLGIVAGILIGYGGENNESPSLIDGFIIIAVIILKVFILWMGVAEW